MKTSVNSYIIDVHLHYSPGDAKNNNPDVIFNEGVIKTIWMLSANATLKNSATNKEVLNLAKRYKGKIIPFAYLDIDGKPEQVLEFKKQGFAGFKVIWASEPYDSKKYFPIWEEVQAASLPVLVHVGGSWYLSPELNIGLEKSFSKNMMPLALDIPLKLFPKIKFILAHFGGDKNSIETGVWLVKGHNRKRGHAPVYMDLSGATSLSWEALRMIKEGIEDIGPEAVIYGSDTSYANAVRRAIFWEILLTISWFKHTDWPAKIMGQNAEKIIQESGWSIKKICDKKNVKTK